MRARILFVCTGNIARSQIAEGLGRALVLPDVEVASAGTRPNPRGIHPLRSTRENIERRLRDWLAAQGLLRANQ